MNGDELKRIRLRLTLTQAQLAERLGVTANTVARWERGEVTITDPMAKLIRLTAQPAIRPDSDGRSADWPKRTRDVDATGKPVARTSKSRKRGR
jgi:transcriptional regulator with XRE-family HTH domain